MQREAVNAKSITGSKVPCRRCVHACVRGDKQTSYNQPTSLRKQGDKEYKGRNTCFLALTVECSIQFLF
jgi:hypothetical protein